MEDFPPIQSHACNRIITNSPLDGLITENEFATPNSCHTGSSLQDCTGTSPIIPPTATYGEKGNGIKGRKRERRRKWQGKGVVGWREMVDEEKEEDRKKYRMRKRRERE